MSKWNIVGSWECLLVYFKRKSLPWTDVLIFTWLHTYTIGRANLSVITTNQLLTPLMLYVLNFEQEWRVLHFNVDRFLRNFSWEFFYSKVFAAKLLRGCRRRNIFSYFVLIVMSALVSHGLPSNKASLSMHLIRMADIWSLIVMARNDWNTFLELEGH